MAFTFSLTYAGVPFLADTAKVVRMGGNTPPNQVDDQLAPRKHQPLADLLDEVNRRIDIRQYLQDFALPPSYPGRNLGALAHVSQLGPMPTPQVRPYDWYYPTGASRWSVFRGLMTSSMVEEVLSITGGNSVETLSMQCVPDSPDKLSPNLYKVESDMYMLPPRPLGDGSGTLDGLFLVTLVDERYYLQNTPVSLTITRGTTWADLITSLGTALGITITQPTISSAYTNPEPDSQLWARQESAAQLLDAVAYNIGRTVVRGLDGTYTLQNPTDSYAIVATNRGPASRVVRMAGGDIFGDSPTDLTEARNSVVPTAVKVSFPQYVLDEAPHFVNPRGASPRPTSWYQDGFGELHTISIPITSGGSFVSGLEGTGTITAHSTAKALLTTEATTTPTNVSGLTALAMQIAGDYYGQQVAAALDEVYPGTYAWTPEGIHDLIWTWSTRIRQAATRVMRTEWNQAVTEFQHSTPGSTYTKGAGGPLVAQTVLDTWSGSVSTALADTLSSGAGGVTATLASIGNLPTDQRWKGLVGASEAVLFEGTSGSLNVEIVYRGIDGTDVQTWASGTAVVRSTPDTNFGVNRWTFGKGMPVFPAQMTSGGSTGVNVVAPLQTVQVLSASGVLINAITHWSGRLQVYDSTQQSGAQFANRELVWVTERNAQMLLSGLRYGAQFSDYSASGVVAPVYIANAGGGSGGTTVYDTAVGYGYLFDITGASGATPTALIAGGISFVSGWEGAIIRTDDRYGITWNTSPALVSGTWLRFVDEDDSGKYLVAQYVTDGAFVPNFRLFQFANLNGDYTNLISSGQKIGMGFGPFPTSTFALTSGCVQSGHIGDAAVNSGNLSSGAVGWPHMASGAIRSGHVADAAVNSGNIASGVVAAVHTQSGIVQGQSGISVDHSASRIMISAQSGIIVPAVSSGADIGVRVTCNLASGVGSGRFNIPAFVPPATISGYEIPFQTETYDTDLMWSGTHSGPIIYINTPGKYICWADLNIYTDDSMPVTDFVDAQIVTYVSGAIQDVIADANNTLQNNNSGYLALGKRYATISLMGEMVFSSGDQMRVRVFNLSQSGILTLSANAGARKVDSVGGTNLSGTSFSMITEEVISGVRAVQISQSGLLRIAMASVSGRMPACGIVMANVVSGANAGVYTYGGQLQASSGLADYSGWVGFPVWVGRSGQVVQWSGSFNSGGFVFTSGGDTVQRLGIATNSGGFLQISDLSITQVQLAAVINGLPLDFSKRQFGV